MRLPDGVERFRWSTARGWIAPDMRPWIEEQLTRWGTLWRAAEHTQDAVILHGRDVVRAIPGPLSGGGDADRGPDYPAGGRVVVRRYLRGGLVSRFVRDRYLRVGIFRPVREMYASCIARERGVPTPRVIAALAYPGGLAYRGEIASEYISDSDDLAGVLFHGRWPGDSEPAGIDERHSILHGAGLAVARLAAAGVHHRDLNAKNILVRNGDDGPEIFVLDLDRASIRPGPIAPGVMAARLERSLQKFEEETGAGISEAGWAAFRAGVEGVE